MAASLPYLKPSSSGAPGSMTAADLDRIMGAINREQAARETAIQAGMKGGNVDREAISRAKDNNYRLTSSRNAYMSPGLVRNFKEAYMDNGNPEYLRGQSEINLGGRQAVELPNAVMQAISAEQSFNEGRSNTYNKYFGKSGDGQYSSYATAQDYLKKAGSNPMFQGSGFMDPSLQANQRLTEITDRRKQLGAMKEKRDVSGNILKPNTQNEMNQLDEQEKQAKSQYALSGNSRQQMFAKDAQARHVASILDNLSKIKATTSNRPFKERIIK